MNACLKKRRPVPVSATSRSGFGFPVARLGFWAELPLFLSEIRLAGIIAQAIIAVKRKKNFACVIPQSAVFWGKSDGAANADKNPQNAVSARTLPLLVQ